MPPCCLPCGHLRVRAGCGLDGQLEVLLTTQLAVMVPHYPPILFPVYSSDLLYSYMHGEERRRGGALQPFYLGGACWRNGRGGCVSVTGRRGEPCDWRDENVVGSVQHYQQRGVMVRRGMVAPGGVVSHTLCGHGLRMLWADDSKAAGGINNGGDNCRANVFSVRRWRHRAC